MSPEKKQKNYHNFPPEKKQNSASKGLRGGYGLPHLAVLNNIIMINAIAV